MPFAAPVSFAGASVTQPVPVAPVTTRSTIAAFARAGTAPPVSVTIRVPPLVMVPVGVQTASLPFAPTLTTAELEMTSPIDAFREEATGRAGWSGKTVS
ncbi:hypothetical protein ACNAW0_09620 [Micromonospora sp. SL1-18]|uniref:hypothetical protein n=1 Tax=Micromonospora sp. SL1-18 TaxID=3399128 RepID=UPI003A4DCE25